jgi:hypothetical protein
LTAAGLAGGSAGKITNYGDFLPSDVMGKFN